MSVVEFLDGRVQLIEGDCCEAIAGLSDASVDSVVTDPPYHLTSIVKRFGADDAAPAKSNGATGVYVRSSTGFMGKQWDGGGIAFDPGLWRDVLRVLKPGGHMVAFGGTRTYHRMVCAIEDAGFEVRDQLAWVFGSGFPKSHDVSKGIDRAAGAEREVVGEKRAGLARKARAGGDMVAAASFEHLRRADLTLPSTDEAIRWQGWGTALKPAWEPIVLARRPLAEATVAAQVLATGTGAINIDGCRVKAEAGDYDHPGDLRKANRHDGRESWRYTQKKQPPSALGRWPANLVHDGSEEVLAAFPETQSGALLTSHRLAESENGSMSGKNYARSPRQDMGGDSGSAARFFYSAKADSDDRVGSKHPTVKPIDLMRWLCRLITPPGGTVLDPFAGTGTTGEAAFYEGFSAILIEREAEYIADIARRMRLVMSGPDERARESIRARMNGKPRDDGPLFNMTRPS